ncbi:hypothetical protein FC96_GL000664 [Secundilactobacillus kimchicus JCM 15530]|uniref:Uncharacterized protein n=1 Tax=Secundilactobacillus kimchicus JCM 15530 TaxID=1302272 RepID=A0A0R1HTV4_9LACO|nr:hypothetical protein FC96_GL000664 [Secundilactobacillus kimchicus JCM 15530]
MTLLAALFSIVLMAILLFEMHGFGQQQIAFNRVCDYYQKQLDQASRSVNN